MPAIASDILGGGGEGVSPRDSVLSVPGLDERCSSFSATNGDIEVASVSSSIARSPKPPGASDGENWKERFVRLVSELIGVMAELADPRLQRPSWSFLHSVGRVLCARAAS